MSSNQSTLHVTSTGQVVLGPPRGQLPASPAMGGPNSNNRNRNRNRQNGSARKHRRRPSRKAKKTHRRRRSH